jgi:uncharacterized membrane protein YfcA
MNPLLPAAIGLVALLYSAVGHAGATGYIAVMTLAGLPPATVRPTALVLNVLVASIATVQFARAGHFPRRLFWPLAAASVPCALVGGAITLPTAAFEGALGLVLLLSAVRIVAAPRRIGTEDAATAGANAGANAGTTAGTAARPVRPTALSVPALAALGAAIGLVAGLTGVGGGVFLTPALLALAVAPVRQIAAVTAPFILVNSLAGLAGGVLAGRPVTAVSLPVVAAAVIGGVAGSSAGAFRLPVRSLELVMAAVLAFASWKLLGRPLGL